MDEPLDRQSVLKVVRATHLLVIHELRRYVRIPVVSQVEIDTGNRTPFTVTAVEVIRPLVQPIVRPLMRRAGEALVSTGKAAESASPERPASDRPAARTKEA